MDFVRLLNQEYDMGVRAFWSLKPIARLVDKIRNVDNRQRICATDFKVIPSHQQLQRLARLQRGQRTSQSSQIKFRHGHAGDAW
jgi:hypothetical protein